MTDRSMGVLQEADEERARRKDNPDDWPQIKARLEEDIRTLSSSSPHLRAQRALGLKGLAEDIRAALQQLEDVQREREAGAADYIRLSARADRFLAQAEAAEAKLVRVVGTLKQIAGDGCGMCTKKDEPCHKLFVREDDWCWCCIARKALDDLTSAKGDK